MSNQNMSNSLLAAAAEHNSAIEGILDSPKPSGSFNDSNRAEQERQQALHSLRSQSVRLRGGRQSSAPYILRGMEKAKEKSGGPTYESLDYDHITSAYWIRQQYAVLSSGRKIYGYSGATFGRWAITFTIGISIGTVAFLMGVGIDQILERKFELIQEDYNVHQSTAPQTILARFVAYNAGLVLFAAVPVVFFAPEAASSGIPEVIGYLNGIHIKRFLRLQTLLAKIVGTIGAVASGLSVGPEGPLVHCGAVLGSGFTRGYKTFHCCGERLRICTVRSKLLSLFRNDTDRRDFISIGAAAGFASAFGAPIGGVLFSLEEAATFWHDRLMWRCLMATALACFTITNLKQLWAIHYGAAEASTVVDGEPGMLSLSTSNNLSLGSNLEMLLCCVVGVVGGLAGSLFNDWFCSLASVRPPPAARLKRLCEAIGVSVVTSMVMAFLIYAGGKLHIPGYRTHPYDPPRAGFSCNCLSDMAALSGPSFGPQSLISCPEDVRDLDDTTQSTHAGCRQYRRCAAFQMSEPGDINGTHCVQCILRTDQQSSEDPLDSKHVDFFCARYGPQFDTHINDTKKWLFGRQSVTYNIQHRHNATLLYQNALGTLFLSSRENGILQIMGAQEFDPLTLALSAVSFFGLTLLAFGAGFPSGVFMPTIMIGCCWGALFGLAVDQAFTFVKSPAPYSLLGAVAMLGGVQRSSLSLVVIIVEGTGKIDYLLPIILTTIVSKWLGDQLNEGLYHTALHRKGMPYLDSVIGKHMALQTVGDVMGREIKTLCRVERVEQVVNTLASCAHHGFPVVHTNEYGDHVLHGLILRGQLLVLLMHKQFANIEGGHHSSGQVDTPVAAISDDAREVLEATARIKYTSLGQSDENGHVDSDAAAADAEALGAAKRNSMYRSSSSTSSGSRKSNVTGVVSELRQSVSALLLHIGGRTMVPMEQELTAIDLEESEREQFLDLATYMNPAPATVQVSCPLNRCAPPLRWHSAIKVCAAFKCLRWNAFSSGHMNYSAPWVCVTYLLWTILIGVLAIVSTRV